MAMDNVDTAGRGFLGDLTPSVLPVYQYQDREQLLNTVKQAVATARKATTSEWCLIEHVNNSIFTSEFLRAEEGPFASWSSYDAQLDRVLLRMVKSKVHEVASETFHDVLHDVIKSMGMGRALHSTGSATHHAAMGGKEADKAWQPIRLPLGRSRDWPSVVLEVAFSESAAKLQSDIRYWLRASGSDVKVVITLQIDQHSPNITIKRWETQDNTPTGHLYQTIEISRNGSQITTKGSPLVIEFEKLFLRSPTEPRERNIHIDDEDLQFLAESVWHWQGI